MHINSNRKVLTSANEIVLIFPDLYQMWAFAQTLTNTTLQINSQHRMLICNCTEEDIALAINKYQAIVKDKIQDNN